MSLFKTVNDSYQKSTANFGSHPEKSGVFKKILLLLKFVLEYLFGLKNQRLTDMPFPREDIERYYYINSRENNGATDCQTIKDLDLVRYTDQFFPEVSIFGQQILYNRLRCGESDADALLSKARYTELIENEASFQHLRDIFKPLREVITEISEFLFFERTAPIPSLFKHLWIFPVISVASFFLSALHWTAIPVFIISFLVVVYLQIITYNKMSEWEPKRLTLCSLMEVADTLAYSAAVKNKLKTPFVNLDSGHKELLNLLRPSKIESWTPWIGEYADWFLLRNIIRYYKCIKLVNKNKELIRNIYFNIGNLEADIAVARHLKQCPQYCWVERHNKRQIVMNEVVNPFLTKAIPMSVNFGEKGIFLSGQNGVGKSTFLRTIGINMLVARAFGFCYARNASFSTPPVYTSIQIEDSLTGGESLYMAELRRAKEFLILSEAKVESIFIIDEIFRGTNHLESVAAAAAFLNTLSKKSVVIISSHNLVLAPLLNTRLEALCIKRIEKDASDVIIETGVLADPNGISLMKKYEFGSEIEAQARKIHNWLGDYLAHPREFPNLLS
jgi:hypothetical protein